MKPPKFDSMIRSFKDLKYFIGNYPVRNFLKALKPERYPKIMIEEGKSEKELFFEAMADVIPVSGKIRESLVGQTNDRPHPGNSDPQEDVLTELNNLIRHGTGFVVAQTPEYMEGTGHRVHPSAAHFLHEGDLSIQAHIDLHGFCVENAKEELNRFLTGAIRTGKRQLLIIHGRGLSSPSEPVLKGRIYQWLTSAPWGKWVIAFSSARACDGGAGATYVLLRPRPLTRRFRKKHIKKNPENMSQNRNNHFIRFR